ncbi:MAG TPA: type I restriction-modification system subunit M N-terminal domain-containing protein [Chitinophagaceae bacterium]|nr:type I restriction-modification system subunit M N-terminal domain-containing protein [Chitinophagaceae bacterium]
MAKTTKTNDKDSRAFEQILWTAADKLRKNIDAVEYKYYVLGLLFLKYVSDAFDELYKEIVSKERDHAYDDPEDRQVYSSYYVFFVPQEARWKHLVCRAKLPTICGSVDKTGSVLPAQCKIDCTLLIQNNHQHKNKIPRSRYDKWLQFFLSPYSAVPVLQIMQDSLGHSKINLALVAYICQYLTSQ